GRPCDPRHKQATICRPRPKPRHTAGCPAIEVRIAYPFHPRGGEVVAAVGVKRHAGVEHFVIRQPDRTLALIPGGMTDTSRGTPGLVAHPRLPVERLSELRALVDALMASCRGEPPRCEGGGDVESATQSKGPFRREAQVAELRPELRSRLTMLL